MVARERGTPFKRNYKETEWREPGEGYNGPEPQKGLYPFTLVDVREHESQAGDDSIKWTFEATKDAEKNGESYAGWRGYKYTNDDAAAWVEQQIMVALGAIKPNGSYSGTLEGLLKKYGNVVVMGRVIRERYIPDDGGEGEWRAKLTGILRPRADTPGAKTTRSAAKDEEDEYTDEEVEERTARAKASARRRGRPAPEPEPEDVDDDEEEGSDEEIDLHELQEELEGMSLVALKKLAKEEYGFTAADVRGLDKEDLVEQIIESLDQEDEADDDEPEEEVEEEPPPPPKRSSTSARAKGASRSTRTTSRTRGTRKADDDEPPF